MSFVRVLERADRGNSHTKWHGWAAGEEHRAHHRKIPPWSKLCQYLSRIVELINIQGEWQPSAWRCLEGSIVHILWAAQAADPLVAILSDRDGYRFQLRPRQAMEFPVFKWPFAQQRGHI